MKKQVISLLTLLMVGFWPSSLMPVMASTVAAFDVPGGHNTVSIAVTGQSVRTVLREIAQAAGFNLMMDESVSGNVTIELDNVTVNEALQSVAALTDIEVVKQSGNIYLAISRQAAQDKGVSRQLSKVIKIYYANANRVADILNRSLFAAANAATTTSGAAAGGGTVTKARADARTNSVIIVGTAAEIAQAEQTVETLDVPRQSKTFYLSHANALDVAAMLASSIFNDGTNALNISGSGGGGASASGGAASGGGTQMSPSTMRVEQQNVQEGTGINTFGSSDGSGGSPLSSVTLRGFVKTNSTVQVSPEGPIVIPDTRSNAVTIMGTAEQIALAESVIPVMDAQLPQVAIEASLVEITEQGIKELDPQWGIADGKMQFGFNNQAVEGILPTPGVGNLIGLPTVDAANAATNGRSGIGLSTNPVTRNDRFLAQVRSLVTTNKAKVLANPTVVATHDTESIISIVDEIVRRVRVEIDSQGFSTQTVELGEAGIVLNILPKIGEDGTLTMRLRPSVTSIREEDEDALGNTITLLSRRDLLTQAVRVKDGETLVIGGLIQQQDRVNNTKLPVGGDLPIVGAMFRASQRSTRRSELVLLVTPHILNNTRPTPVTAVNNSLEPQMDARMLGGEK